MTGVLTGPCRAGEGGAQALGRTLEPALFTMSMSSPGRELGRGGS